MELSEITEEAIGLSEKDRATLACRLLDTLPPSELGVTDREIEQRDNDLDNGSVAPISHAELTRRVQAARGT